MKICPRYLSPKSPFSERGLGHFVPNFSYKSNIYHSGTYFTVVQNMSAKILHFVQNDNMKFRTV